METWNYMERLGDAEAGEIGALASVALGAKRIATAVRTAAGNLTVIVWEVQYDGTVTLLGSGEGGPTSRVAIAALTDTDKLVFDDEGVLKPHGHRFVTAARTEAGGMKLTVWDVDKDGEVTRRGSGETGEIHGEFAVATFSIDRVVTAVRDSSDNLKLVSWNVAPNGTVQRLESASAEQVDQIAIATYDPYPPNTLNLATAVRTKSKSGNLKIIAWAVDSAGRFMRLGDATGGAVRDVVAATLSHRRIVTAARNTQNRLDVQTWDFDAQGNVSPHASGHAGEISSLAMSTSNAARVMTAVRDASGNLKVIVWDAIDDIVRLGEAQAGTVGLVSIVPLGSDWVATPVATAASTLKVIVWREHGVSLLHADWGPKIPRFSKAVLAALAARFDRIPSDAREEGVTMRVEAVESTAPEDAKGGRGEGPSPSPKISFSFEPGIDNYLYDPMIAVGFKYMIVTQDHEIGFFDKEGKLLKDKDGKEVKPISTTEFFSIFLAGRRSDGSRNEHCIHRHTGYRPGEASPDYPPGTPGDPDAPMAYDDSDGPRINEFFDTRVRFDSTSRRFFILASARPEKKVSGVSVSKVINPLARRYWAFAVSKTEDPRAGFHQWMTTEGHWFDYTYFAINQGVMVMTTSVGLAPLTIPPYGMKPAAFVFSVEDLREGKPYPRCHKLFPPEFPLPASTKKYTDVVPLTHHGDTAGRTFFILAQGVMMSVFSFRNPSDWRNFPAIDKTSEKVSISGKDLPVAMPTEGATFRNGKIYLTWQHELVGHKPDVQNGRYAIRLLRLPLKSLSTTPTISTKAADGFGYVQLPNELSGDLDPGDIVSFECPSVTVNKHGHVVLLFGRVGYKVKFKQLPPDARYIVYYSGEPKPRRSGVIRAGTVMPSERDADGNTLSTIYAPHLRLDYQTVVCDPSDDETVWMISEFANSKVNYRTVVGKVKP